MEGTAPWEQQPKETARSFKAFAIYRDLGHKRSLPKVAMEMYGEATPSKIRTLDFWKADHGWIRRVQLWDMEQDRLLRQEQEEARKEMAKRHAAIATMMQQKVIDRLRGLDASLLTPDQLAKFLDIAVKVERLSRGEPTEQISTAVAQESVHAVLAKNVSMEARKRLEDAETDEEFVEILEEEAGDVPEVRELIAQLKKEVAPKD